MLTSMVTKNASVKYSVGETAKDGLVKIYIHIIVGRKGFRTPTSIKISEDHFKSDRVVKNVHAGIQCYFNQRKE